MAIFGPNCLAEKLCSLLLRKGALIRRGRVFFATKESTVSHLLAVPCVYAVRIVGLVACFGWLLAAPDWSQGQESLLGMPAPRDPASPGAIVLHGGGTVTDDAFERFVELAGGKNARIVFVPCAGFRREWYASDATYLAVVGSRYGSWPALAQNGQIRSFQFLYTDNPADADDVIFTKPLETATGVWFSGGLQSRLNYRFVGNYPQQTRFQKLLRDVLVRGGVVGGTSAGMAAIPEVMTFAEDRPYTSGPASVVAAHGFGLLTRAIVEQHFDARGGRLERFTGLLRDSGQLDQLAGRRGAGEQMIGLAVEERTALVLQGNQLQVAGTGAAHVFLKSRFGRSLNWTELAPGETAFLTRNAKGITSIAYEEIALAR